MGYSSENERQNKVLGDLIKGKAPEKRVMVGYEGNKEPAKHGDIISPLSAANSGLAYPDVSVSVLLFASVTVSVVEDGVPVALDVPPVIVAVVLKATYPPVVALVPNPL